MAELFDRLLVSCPNGGGLFLLHGGIAHKLDNLDTTGLDVQVGQVVRAIQPASLVLLNTVEHELNDKSANIDDLHDAYFDGNSCYVVSTHGNEILRLDARGEEERRWTLPGEVDAWHINGITRWNGRMVFSAFADRPQHRAYKEPPFEVGFVQDLETGDRPITGLFQPHSLVPDGGQLLLANSGTSEIHSYDAGGNLLRRRRLDGYTRGIARAGKVIYVGLSKSRNADTEAMPSAALVALDAKTWKELGRVRLPVDEIYAVAPLRDSDAVATLAKVASHANARSSETLARLQQKHVGAEQAREHLTVQLDAVVRDRDERVRDSDRRIFGLLETVHGKDIQIQNRDEIIRGKDAEIESRERVIHDKDAEIARREGIIHGNDVATARREGVIQDKDAEIARRERVIHDKDAEIARRERVIHDKDAEIALRERVIHDKDAEIARREGVIREKDAEVARRDQIVRGKEEHLQQRDQAVLALSNELRRLGDAVRSKDTQIKGYIETEKNKDTVIDHLESALRKRDGMVVRAHALAAELDQLKVKASRLVVDLGERESKIAAMESSRSWRVTRPLRLVKLVFLRRRAAREGATSDAGPHPTRPESTAKPASTDDTDQPGSRQTIRSVSSIDPSVLTELPLDDVPIAAAAPAEHRFDLHNCGKSIGILTTTHCTYVAELIAAALARVGVQSHILYNMPKHGYEDVPHFVICPQMFDKLPGLYVAFQMEQSVSSRWFTDDYIRKLESSFAVLDYSLVNIAKLEQLGLYPQQIYYTPIDYLSSESVQTSTAEAYEYDVLFYGDDKNERRQRFLGELGKVCKVKVLNNMFGDQLHAEMAKAKLVVNIHYYVGALLETTRLWESLSLGNLVVSERSADMDQHQDLVDLVDFVDTDDVAGMVVHVRHWLDNDSLRKQRALQNRKRLEVKYNRFDYHFYRFLLATDNVSFDQFWALAGRKVELQGDKLCLNLPEWSERTRDFDKDNRHGFVRFTGLRHRKGWLGCAMSYKLMIMLARQHGLPAVTICEDDVEFPPDFDARWSVIQNRLEETRPKWDVFSGLMADFHPESKILETFVDGDVRYVVTDKLISMVFNVYSANVYDVISSWNEREHDVIANTIDRYLEGKSSIRVLTTCPFLVGHKEALRSTLWGIENSEYADLITASAGLLKAKLEDRLRLSADGC